MKNSAFLIFFSIVLLLYGLINYYLFKRGWQALTFTPEYRHSFLILFLILVLAYPLGRLAERLYCCGFTQGIVFVGSLYLAFMVYAFFMVLIIDFLRLGNFLLGIFPSFIRENPGKTKFWIFLFTLFITAGTVLVGHINALHPRIKTYEITVNKTANQIKQLKIVLASDIHLGTIIRNSRLLKIVNKINSLHPDLVLLPGDVVDEDIAPVANQNMAVSLQKIQSKYGTFAITGNHEYFGGVDRAVRYIEESGITVLQDSVIKIAESFYLIGRKDLMAERMESGREPLNNLVENLDYRLPKILMDHQPFHLEQAQKNGIDLQISGHTHHGQLFPFNLITKKIYELSAGYLKKGNTHYYVSCGVGTWGPPVRIGNSPEIVQITVHFESETP
jgi:predicted MPP superfamily phosphohydrolase